MNLQADTQSRVKLNEKCVVLGRNDCGQLWRHVIIVGKYVIQRKKDLRIECFIARMYEDFKTERMTASMDNRYTKLVRKWGPLIRFFEQRYRVTAVALGSSPFPDGDD